MIFHSFDETIHTWGAIRTPAQWEMKTANLLYSKNISIFLPTMTRIVKYRTRTQRSAVPLFPGYVFFDVDKIPHMSGLSDEAKRCVVQILKTSDQVQLYDELKAVASLLCNHELIREKVFGKVGESVRIKGGSFAGFDGKIVRFVDSRRRLIIAVSYLGSSVEVELDEQSIEKTAAGT